MYAACFEGSQLLASTWDDKSDIGTNPCCRLFHVIHSRSFWSRRSASSAAPSSYSTFPVTDRLIGRRQVFVVTNTPRHLSPSAQASKCLEPLIMSCWSLKLKNWHHSFQAVTDGQSIFPSSVHPSKTLYVHCISDIWSSDIRSIRPFGQFLDGTERNGVSYIVNYLILGPRYWTYGQFWCQFWLILLKKWLSFNTFIT